jgi:sugar lactone lactonase YvrE
LAVSALFAPTSAAAQPSSIVVIDRTAGTNTHGLLFSVDLRTGTRTVISQDIGIDPGLVATDAAGNILVLDRALRKLFSVNPLTRAITVIADGFGDPTGLAVDVSNILVADRVQNVLFSVDPASGTSTVVSNFNDGEPFGGQLGGVAVDATGNILVIDDSFPQPGAPGGGQILKVETSSGRRTLLSAFGFSGQGPPGLGLQGIAIDPSGGVWVLSLLKPNPGAFPTDAPRLFKIDPANGNRTVKSDFTDTSGPQIRRPRGIAADSSGNIWVVDEEGPTGRGALFKIDATSGFRTIVHDFGDPAKGDLGVDPTGLAFAAPAPPQSLVDLTIANMEITQGIQNLANDVPLVADKTTYVRVYPRADSADRRVGARLRAFRGSIELPGSPLRPLYPLANVHTTPASREALSDTFNFLVPPSWRTRGEVVFQAEINHDGVVPETNTGNNTFNVSAQFTSRAPICLVMVPVRTHGSRYTDESPAFEDIIARFKSLWPLPDVWVYYDSNDVAELQGRLGIPPWEFGPYEITEPWGLLNGPADSDKIILSLAERALFNDPPRKCRASDGIRTHYVGMVSPDTFSDLKSHGYAALGWSAASWVQMNDAGGEILAQEVAHNYNDPLLIDKTFLHVDCRDRKTGGHPPDINPSYPYDPCNIGPVNPNLEDPNIDPSFLYSTFWGFDTVTIRSIPPNHAADFMSYARPTWVSDYTWRNLLNVIFGLGIGASTQAVTTTSELAILSESPEILALGGVIIPLGNVAYFQYAYRLPQGVISPRNVAELPSSTHAQDGASAYVLQLVHANGTVLFSQAFDSFGHSQHAAGSPSEMFAIAVPFDPSTARIRILSAGQQLGTLIVSPHPPQVQILQPVSGETITDQLIVRWFGSDPDNDLFYTVQYSPDFGVSWQTLVNRTPESTLTIPDTRSLPGSNGPRGLIRVIASDGVNTDSAVSDPFILRPHPPRVHIVAPSDGASFLVNSQIVGKGGARDSEDGTLPDEALLWSVDNQFQSVGQETALDGLQPGVHVIALTAVDSDGETATTRVTITVVDDRPVAAADSYRTPENTTLSVAMPGVLGNDLGPEGSSLSAVLVSGVSNGTVWLEPDGSFSYSPYARFTGIDSFTYKANNGIADSNVVTVNLTVGIVSNEALSTVALPPLISGLPSGSCGLWPPNHKLVQVATVTATDQLGLAFFNVTGSSNEPSVPNDPDIVITGAGLGPRVVKLKSERLGTGTGRIYTLMVTATNLAGVTSTATSTCTVPHDQGKK